MHLQDYEVSNPQRQFTFAEEHANAVTNADVLSCICKMTKESSQLRQDVQCISDIIANSLALVPMQVSSRLSHFDYGVSVTSMTTSMLASPQNDQNPSQSDKYSIGAP